MQIMKATLTSQRCVLLLIIVRHAFTNVLEKRVLVLLDCMVPDPCRLSYFNENICLM